MWSVARGLIDIVIVLLMSTSWTPMLARAGPEFRQYASSPCGLTVVYQIPTPLNLASRNIACNESTINQQFKK